MVPGAGPADPHAADRERLQSDLLAAVKQCQTRFGGRSELATELDPNVVYLCAVLELVLSHGLKSGKHVEKKTSAIRQVTDLVCGNNESLTLWNAVREILSHHERERYELLRHVWTDRGRGRAWLRSALNEHSLERYLVAFLAYNDLTNYYEDWAFVCDQETNSILTNMAAGLGSILFAMSIDKPELNHVGHFGGLQAVKAEITEHVIQDPLPVKKKQDGKRSKKGVENIISFDDDNLDINLQSSSESNEVGAVTGGPVIDVQLQDGESYAVECAEEATNVLCDIDLSNSDTEHIADNEFSSMSSSAGLRPVSNSSIGELIPVPITEETHSSEDSVSVPSFSEENEVTVSSSNNEKTNLEPVCVESLQKEVTKLRKNLEHVNEINVTLRSQIIQANLLNQQKQQENDTKIQELNRENELLKHQLRKYVSAVQMLRQDSQSGQEDDNIFEQKLVQVAEMHGELMELNERLQRNLIGKEGIIRRLYLELEALRGPLGPTEVDIHTQIISLWVPSVFLTGTAKPYHVYQVHIRIAEEEWNVYRRYAQFYVLHKETKKQYPVISAFQFPPKKTIGNKDAKFVEERRVKLQQYLRRLLNHIVANTPSLANAPTKSLLTSVIPFFGEQNEPALQRKPSPKTSLPRVSIHNSPQYSGL